MTPHRITKIRVGPLPTLSSMREVSVRTYVNDGVLFTRLYTNNRAAIAAAKRLYRVRYERATIRLHVADDAVTFESEPFRARYGPAGATYGAQPGTLEHFLVERRVLYVENEGAVYRCDVECEPWRLQPAWARIEHNDLAPADEPLSQFAARQDVVFSQLERLS